MMKAAPAAAAGAASFRSAPARSPSVAERRKWFADGWRPADREDTYEIKRVSGEIPREIHGTLYRNGPSQRIMPREGYEALHLFDGDGLVHAFRFDDGRVHYTGRFVRNASYLREQSEGRFCMSSVGAGVEDPILDVPFRQQPNTNVVYHGGKLMALVENAFPFEIDACTLDPIGENTFGGRMLGVATTAHPKIDGRSGQMLIHGYQPVPPYLQWYTIEPDGTCSLAEIVDAPYPAMMHDFAITEHYVIFPLCPIVMDAEALMTPGRPLTDALRWAPELGMKFGVRRREADAPVRWFDVPTAGYMFHPGNAYEDGDRIVLDACTYLDPPALLESLKTWRRGVLQPGYHAVPFVYEIDFAAGCVAERQLDDRGCEFPRLDDRRIGYPTRFGYAVRQRQRGDEDGWSTLLRYDRAGGPTSAWDFGFGCSPSEPVFVPRSADAAEDEGFVLCTSYDGPQDATYLNVFDARDIGAGPLARARLEHRIPHGFHGNFASGVV
jgi:carotenoid cleavage dioxygenase-like enzyme